MPTVAEALLTMHLEQFTGKVTFKKDQVTKTIFFRKGKPIYVDSNIRSETLGQILLQGGRLTEEQYRKVLEEMESTGQRQGEIIARLGFLSGFEVYEALSTQLGRKIQNCFLLEGAEIQPAPGDDALKDVPELPIDFFRLYLDIVYSTYLALDDDLLPAKKAVSLTSAGQSYLQAQSLTPNESKLYRFLDGRHGASDLFARVARDDAEPFLFALKEMKFLDFKAMPPPRYTKPIAEAASEKEKKEDPAQKPRNEASRVVEIKDDLPPEPSSPIYTYALRMTRPYHEFLDLPQNSNRFQVKKCYDTLVRDLNLFSIPENYEGKDREIAEKVFDRMTLALTILSDDKRKHEYFQSLAKHTPEGAVEPTILAESAAQKARVFASKRRFDQAEEQVRKAIELMPKEAAYHVELAELHMLMATANREPLPESVEKTLKEAMKLNSSEPDAFLQLAIYYKVTGDTDKARACYQKVLDLKPNHPKATAELRLLNMRAASKKGESPLLKLFKKK